MNDSEESGMNRNNAVTPIVYFGTQAEAQRDTQRRLERMVIEEGRRRIVEIGAGANPFFGMDFIQQHGLDYTLLDISQRELDKAPEGFKTVCADVCADQLPDECIGYDLAFSRMLAEHVPDGRRFHSNVYSMLKEGGRSFHFFPTLFAPPFVVNWILPDSVSSVVLRLLQPGREPEGRLGKFPARYSWCRGPIESQIKKFESLGFDVIEYVGYYGHDAYYQKIPALLTVHRAISLILKKYPVAALTSLAHVVLEKRPRLSKHDPG